MSKKIGFQGLSGKEWAKMSRSVITKKDIGYGARTKLQKLHGATFPIELAEYFIKIYCPKDGAVLDPFLGVGSTLIAAQRQGRRGHGIELYSHFTKIAKKAISQQRLFDSALQTIVTGDCIEKLKEINSECVDFTFTSPPYVDLAHRLDRRDDTLWERDVLNPYGNSPRDLGNMSYDLYLLGVLRVMKQLYRVTKKDGYCAWVVRDIRNTKEGQLIIPVHMDIAKRGTVAGWKLLDFIIWDQNEDRPLGVLGFPSKMYMNINHTYIVVWRKD